MNIAYSQHAKKRLKERMKVSDKKLLKVIRKAWESPGVPTRKVEKAYYKTQFVPKHNRTVRELMGYVFVFAMNKKGDAVTLITVF